MLIHDQRLLGDIKAEFSAQFSALKIEFYERSHEAGEGSRASDQLPDGASLGSVRTRHAEGNFQIQPTQTVGEVEGLFAELYGLYAQIFRLTKGVWMQTTSTDHWTLEQQQAHATQPAYEIDRTIDPD